MKPPSVPPEQVGAPVSIPERLAARALFKEAFPYVLRTLRHLGTPGRDQPDLAQEILITAYRRRHTYDSARSSLRAWIYGITFNFVRNDERKRRRRERVVREDAPEEIDAMLSPEEQGINREEQRRILQELLAEIPFEQRAVVVAHDLDELEMKEIAEQQGIPLSTAYDRYRRGAAALERAYERRRKEEEGSGAIAVPWALAQLFEADREVHEVPADMEEAAWKRFHRAVRWDGICDLVRWPAVRSALIFLAGAGAGAALFWALSLGTRAPAPVIASAPIAAAAATVVCTPAPAPSAAAAVVEVAETPAQGSASPVAPPPARDRAASPSDALGEQRAFDTAASAFQRGDLGAALAALDAQERAYPRGNFVSEREALRTRVLVQRGRSAAAPNR
ncbi:MAG: RNA polymerase sigma factor [Byssovorax sp.]